MDIWAETQEYADMGRELLGPGYVPYRQETSDRQK